MSKKSTRFFNDHEVRAIEGRLVAQEEGSDTPQRGDMPTAHGIAMGTQRRTTIAPKGQNLYKNVTIAL